jgi:hypothetical protein
MLHSYFVHPSLIRPTFNCIFVGNIQAQMLMMQFKRGGINEYCLYQNLSAHIVIDIDQIHSTFTFFFGDGVHHEKTM